MEPSFETLNDREAKAHAAALATAKRRHINDMLDLKTAGKSYSESATDAQRDRLALISTAEALQKKVRRLEQNEIRRIERERTRKPQQLSLDELAEEIQRLKKVSISIQAKNQELRDENQEYEEANQKREAVDRNKKLVEVNQKLREEIQKLREELRAVTKARAALDQSYQKKHERFVTKLQEDIRAIVIEAENHA